MLMNHKRKLVECLACVDESRAAIHCKHQDMFREVVRRFMREELAPQQKAFEEAGQPSREIWRALGKMVCCLEGSQSQCYPNVVLNEVYADNDTTFVSCGSFTNRSFTSKSDGIFNYLYIVSSNDFNVTFTNAIHI